jgi:hypothetical protein
MSAWMMLSMTARFFSVMNATLGGGGGASGGTSSAFSSRARGLSPLPPLLPSAPLVAELAFFFWPASDAAGCAPTDLGGSFFSGSGGALMRLMRKAPVRRFEPG